MSLFYKTIKNDYGEKEIMKTANVVIASVVLGLVVIAGLMFALPNYNRYQKRAHATNEVQINDIKIAQTKQLVEVEKQKAQIRIADAEGIAKSQQIIANSLTNQYLQYEAIEAQKAEINGNNHTVIYIPSGNNGIPFVQDLSKQ